MRSPVNLMTIARALGCLPALATGCVWSTDLPAGAGDIHVVPERELLVTDDALVSGRLALNATAGPLSFRYAVDHLPVDPVDGGAVLGWLRSWSGRLAEAGGDRARAFEQGVTCRWLKASADNHCDAACAACASFSLRMDAAPLRLIAVINRTDLAVMPDRAADGGEGRLVYALTDGPADDPASPSLPATVIVEYAQRGTAIDWTSRWHALGGVSEAEFPAKLVALTDTFVASGSLSQVRTADAWTGPMIMHQFALDAGRLVAAKVRNTPDWSLVSAALLDTFVQTNAAPIHDGTVVLPAAWWAEASSPSDAPPGYVTSVSGHDDLLHETCGGCHAQSANGFQIDPLVRGTAKLSRFLVDPSKGQDELRRRVAWLQIELSGNGI